jgi:phage replication-related protein YjqB (UPF0714/DUF867 family)
VADLYASYTALAAGQTEGVDYERRSVPVTGATWASIAIHGGAIEAGSGEMARYVGAGLMNHYEFAGIMSSGNFATLHVTSTNFDEPICQGIVTPSRRTLSFHGYTGDGTPVTSIGGLDTVTKARISTALTDAGFTVITAAQEISGSDPANITNTNAISAGVQIEMSAALRASFFPDGDTSRTMRDSGQRTDTFYAYAAAILAAYDGQGMVSQGSINVSRWALMPAPGADVDLTVTMATDKLATGGSHFLALAARATDTSNTYLARVEFSITQTVVITLRKRVAGTETLLIQQTTALTHAASTRFGVRMQTEGSALRARVWLASGAEPAAWDVTTTDTDLTAPGQVGMRSILSSANTNALPVVASYDDLDYGGSPQQFTVTRSVNDVVKTHQAMAPISLFDITYAGL